MPDDIYDGTLTITFASFYEKTESIDFTGTKTLAYPKIQKQVTIDPGARRRLFGLSFSLVSTDGGDSAWTKYQNLLTLWQANREVYGYQRRLRFVKPGTYPVINRIVYGKIQNITVPVVYAHNAKEITGTLDFVEDVVSKPSP